jgi:hypothetical protein
MTIRLFGRGSVVRFISVFALVSCFAQPPALWHIGFNDKTRGALQHANQYVALEKDVFLQFFLGSPDEAGLKDFQPYIQSLHFQGRE